MSRYHPASPIQTSSPFRPPNNNSKMASQRRLKIYAIILVAIIVSVFFYTSRSSPLPNDIDDFYARTKSALDGDKIKTSGPKAGTPGAEQERGEMQQRLREAADSAKENANKKAPKPDAPSVVVGMGSAADGSGDKSMKGKGKKYPISDEEEEVEVLKEETEEEHNAEQELNFILKKSPIIIFSKSYCPHSKRAKGILLDKYILDPAPFVVELDQHEQGAQLQNLLAEKTGRRTVPNVLINGVSIGGGDDVADLDARDMLGEKIREYGGKKIVEVKRRLGEGKGGLR